MKKNISIILGLIILAFGTFCFVRLINNCNYYIDKIKSKDVQLENVTNTNSLYVIYAGVKIPSNTTYIDVDGNVCSLARFADKSAPIVVFRCSETNCSACIDAQINILQEDSLFEKNSDLCVVGNYSSNRKLNYFVAHNDIETTALNIKTLLGLDKDINKPYLFVLQKDLTVTHLFIPDNNEIDKMKDYMNYINKKYNFIIR